MNNQITQTIINSVITWFVSPETILFLIGFVINLPKIVKMFQNAKKEDYKSIAYVLAQDITNELIKKPLDNVEKRNVAVSWIYNQLPSNAKKYLSDQDLIEIVNSAYHTYVKPESGK